MKDIELYNGDCIEVLGSLCDTQLRGGGGLYYYRPALQHIKRNKLLYYGERFKKRYGLW